MIIDEEVYLEHHGVKGQKWGVRNDPKFGSRAKKVFTPRLAKRVGIGLGLGAAIGTGATVPVVAAAATLTAIRGRDITRAILINKGKTPHGSVVLAKLLD